jgi:hypothetical protein
MDSVNAQLFTTLAQHPIPKTVEVQIATGFTRGTVFYTAITCLLGSACQV